MFRLWVKSNCSGRWQWWHLSYCAFVDIFDLFTIPNFRTASLKSRAKPVERRAAALLNGFVWMIPLHYYRICIMCILWFQEFRHMHEVNAVYIYDNFIVLHSCSTVCNRFPSFPTAPSASRTLRPDPCGWRISCPSWRWWTACGRLWWTSGPPELTPAPPARSSRSPCPRRRWPRPGAGLKGLCSVNMPMQSWRKNTVQGGPSGIYSGNWSIIYAVWEFFLFI